jgi:hypothetical protein
VPPSVTRWAIPQQFSVEAGCPSQPTTSPRVHPSSYCCARLGLVEAYSGCPQRIHPWIRCLQEVEICASQSALAPRRPALPPTH